MSTLHLSKGDTASFDAVVLAVPPRQVARILGDPSRYGIENLDAYDAYPIVDVHLWHDGGNLGFDFAAALDSPLQWIFEKAPGYLCCSISAADEYMRLPTEELETLAWREVQAFLPALKNASLMRSAVTRNPEATWLPRVGAARTSQRTAHAAIAIAGSWTDTALGRYDGIGRQKRKGRCLMAARLTGCDRLSREAARRSTSTFRCLLLHRTLTSSDP